MEYRLSSLKKKFTVLNELIQKEMSRPLPDSLRLSTLKRQRLYLEEQLSSGQ